MLFLKRKRKTELRKFHWNFEKHKKVERRNTAYITQFAVSIVSCCMTNHTST